MEKNTDGYYRIFTNQLNFGDFGDESTFNDEQGLYLKIDKDKIIDCFVEKSITMYNMGETYPKPNSLNKIGDVENNLEKLVGESFKDFVLKGALDNEFLGKNLTALYGDNDSDCVIRFVKSSEENFTKEKQKAFPTKAEMKAHDQKVADILQAKENKNTLGNCVLSKIAEMKGRTGEK